MKKIRALLVLVVSFLVFTHAVYADSTSIDFESFSIDNINGQFGWSKTGPYDHAVSENLLFDSMSNKSLRISDAITSGSFGDHTISASLTDEAGETNAENDGLSGGARSDYFEASWDFASADPGNEQVGLHLNISPDRGDGARMSYVGQRDTPTGLEVFFYDYIVGSGGPNVCDGTFQLTPVASDLTRSTPHSIKIQMWFVDGHSNDVVTVTVDGTETYTGTSWEDYFTGCEKKSTRTVDSLIFLTRGTAHPENMDKGFFIDNITMTTIEPLSVVRSAEIISPTEGEVVQGMVDFDATLTDKDRDDSVQWAVRKGTCAANTNTVLGNVDGFNSPFTWNHINFHASADTTAWVDGDYCFIFNPTESMGDTPIRLTREFVVDNTPNSQDQCKNGSWKNWLNPLFKNQGDCVSWLQASLKAMGNRKDN